MTTILDFEEQRELRRRAAWDRWEASQERELAEISRALDRFLPFFDQWLAQKKVRVRRPRCESPGCWNTITTLHPLQGRTCDDAPALVALCARHLSAVRKGFVRVSAEDAETLLWQLCDRPDAPPSLEVRRPRRRARTPRFQTRLYP